MVTIFSFDHMTDENRESFAHEVVFLLTCKTHCYFEILTQDLHFGITGSFCQHVHVTR